MLSLPRIQSRTDPLCKQLRGVFDHPVGRGREQEHEAEPGEELVVPGLLAALDPRVLDHERVQHVHGEADLASVAQQLPVQQLGQQRWEQDLQHDHERDRQAKERRRALVLHERIGRDPVEE